MGRTVLVILIFVTFAGVLPFPILECPICRGIARRVQACGISERRSATGCPSCRDCGKVPLLRRALEKPISEPIRTLIQNPPGRGTDQRPFFAALAGLLLKNGARVPDMDRAVYWGQARFPGTGDRHVLAVIVYELSLWLPSSTHLWCWLFDERGKLLDAASGHCQVEKGSLDIHFVAEEAPDRACIRFDALGGWVDREQFGGFIFVHGGERLIVGPGKESCRADWLATGVSRLAIRGGKFHVLP